MINFIFCSFLIACMVWVYHIILREDLISKWFRFGFKYFGKDEDSWKHYIYQPIWGCQYCTAGQLALWTYIFIMDYYSFFYHIGFIALTIFITRIIFYGQNYIDNQA